MPAAAPPGWNAALTKLFGDIKAFSAKADLRVLDQGGHETTTLTGMGFALLDEKVWIDIDLASMKSAQMPPAMVSSLKQMGMDHLVSVIAPAKKTMLLSYPALRATVEMPLPDSETAAASQGAKLDQTKVGEETLDRLACVKNNVVITDGQGQKREALVWNAASLQGFPVQIRFAEGGNTLEMHFRQIKLGKPDARQFEPPAGYMKYTDFTEFMGAAVQKSMGAGAGKK